MTLTKWDELQLKFDLDLDEVGEDARERAITPEQARLISEAARQAWESLPEKRNNPQGNSDLPKDRGVWFGEYLRLRGQGWPWRVACYIGWASSPKANRWPTTLEKLATDILGLCSARAIYSWRKKYPSLDASVSLLEAAPLWEHRADVLWALAQMAKQEDYKAHNDRKLFLEMIGDYIPRSQLGIGKPGEDGSVQAMSDAELRRWITETNYSGSEEEPDPAPDGDESLDRAEGLDRIEVLDAE